MPRKRHNKPVPVEALKHRNKRRNIPTQELQDFVKDEELRPQKMLYARDPSLDPQLVWKGKDEQDRHPLEVPVVPVYIQEKISPQALIEDLRRGTPFQGVGHGQDAHATQLNLFADFNGIKFEELIEFYRHEQNWANRMILGDSLLVMTSLAEKEGLKGKVQMIYFDPPYGIKFGSNWQVSTRKRDVKDGKVEDATRQPEQIRAFRDTWQLGIHSYLAYLRDRLTVARELLTETGSIFVQIGDENVHLVRCILDEVFGSENFAGMIIFAKTGSMVSKELGRTSDFLLWYGKNKPHLKYHQLFAEKQPDDFYSNVELPDGTIRKIGPDEMANTSLLPAGARVFQLVSLESPGAPTQDTPFEYEGQVFRPAVNRHWQLTYPDGMQVLRKSKRIVKDGGKLRWKYYIDDYPIKVISQVWTDTAGFNPDQKYVVETRTKVAERCLLMTTDPGDLVLDPTCVRKGTRVWVVVGEGECSGDENEDTPLSPPASGGRASGGRAPSPCTGRAGVGLVPIEDLRAGDWVYAHDGQPHRVLRSMSRQYRGLMIGLHHNNCEETLWVTSDHLILTERRVKSLGPHGGWNNIPRDNFKRARSLRKEMSMPERILWSRLKNNQLGVKFRRQHPIGPYIADFYSREAALVVEVDGGMHGDPNAMAYDAERDRFMEHLGLRVLRFTASEVVSRPNDVAAAVADVSAGCVLPEDSAKQWRRAEELRVGDLVYHGIDQEPVPISSIERTETLEEVYDVEVEGAHSFLTDVCAVHNCGSGTTAYVAEQWGRRWITIDTSRVALALARTRLMCAKYPYYLLADSPEGAEKEREVSGKWIVASGAQHSANRSSLPTNHSPLSTSHSYDVRRGFVYRRVPHVTLKSIANNPEIREGMTREEIERAIAKYADTEILYDQPYEDPRRIRVTGPFTVESLSPHRAVGPIGVSEQSRSDFPIGPSRESEEMVRIQFGPTVDKFVPMIIENLRKAGVQNTPISRARKTLMRN